MKYSLPLDPGITPHRESVSGKVCIPFRTVDGILLIRSSVYWGLEEVIRYKTGGPILSENKRLHPKTVVLALCTIEVLFNPAAKQQMQPVSRPEIANLPLSLVRRHQVPCGEGQKAGPPPQGAIFCSGLIRPPAPSADRILSRHGIRLHSSLLPYTSSVMALPGKTPLRNSELFTTTVPFSVL